MMCACSALLCSLLLIALLCSALQVSKDGVHKLVAIWQYDKREINGAVHTYITLYGVTLPYLTHHDALSIASPRITVCYDDDT